MSVVLPLLDEKRRLSVTVFVRAEPQGSSKAFIVGGKARITSTNKKMKPFRSELTRQALWELAQAKYPQPLFPRHTPVHMDITFTFVRPKSAAKRQFPSVAPDCDKLCRSVGDALTGVAYLDDAQVVSLHARKVYGLRESVTVHVEEALYA